MRLFNERNGILSLADARRDANLSREGAKDQYESDVADFKDSFVTDLENDFMSSDNTYMNPLYIPPSVSLDMPPMENIYDSAINTPTRLPNERSGFFGNLMDNVLGQLYDTDEFNIDDDGYSGFIGNLINNVQDELGENEDLPQDPPQDPPVTFPAPRPMYRPSTDFSSGAPALNMAITPREFGTTPGFEPPPPPKLVRAPDDKSKRPPIDRPPYVPPPRFLLENQNNGMKFGGALNAGIMRLPQSQQGDTMTTRIFQNAFKPRR